jgi:CHAT domain-containing protein
MSLLRSGRNGRLRKTAFLLMLFIFVEGYSPGALAASGSPPAAGVVTLTEDQGDRQFKAGNYRDSAQEYARAMKTLGLDAERFRQRVPGTLPKLQDPLRAAILMRKWARATQLDFEAEYGRGRNPPLETLLQALFAVSSAANVFDGLRQNVAIAEEPSARKIMEELRQAYDIQIEICYLLFGQQDLKARALKVSDKARARSIFDFAYGQKLLDSFVPQNAEMEERRLMLRVRIGELSQTLLAERAESEPRPNITADLEERLRIARADLDSLRPTSNRDAPTKDSVPDATALAFSSSWRFPADIVGSLSWRQELKVGEAVIQYHLTDRYAYAFYVPDVGPVQMRRLRSDVRELHSLVESYVDKLRNPHLPWKPASIDLYVKLLSPFDHLIETLDHLFIVPSGFLYAVPFGTLSDPRSGKVLAERVAHSIVPHMALIALTPAVPKKPRALILGIRDFAQHGTLSLGEEEAVAVRDILGESTKLILGSKGDATREELLSELPKCEIVHLSTHGLPDQRSMLSHIVLKRQDGGDDSISALDLLEVTRPSPTLLVTLSACETGRVDPGKGDDILGLPRAFLLTGSTTVVATLWRIPEDSTKYIMEQFYTVLRTTRVNVSTAMAIAQRRTAVHRGKQWEHPYYWGAAVVIGNGTVVPFTSTVAK